MKKRMGKRAKKFFFICLAVCFILLGNLHLRQAQASQGQVTILIDADMAQAALKRYQAAWDCGDPAQAAGYSIWCEQKNKAVFDKNSGRQRSVSVISFTGSSQLLLPYGVVLHDSDEKGCLLDKRTAKELIGDDHVIGAVLLIDGRECTIRGVFDSPRNLVLLPYTREGQEWGTEEQEGSLHGQTQEKGDADCWRITIQREIARTCRQTAERWMQTAGVTGRMVRLDLLTGVSWVREMLPGKFSDFDQIINNAVTKRDEILMLMQAEKTCLEMQCLSDWLEGVLFCFAGWLLLYIQGGKA